MSRAMVWKRVWPGVPGRELLHAVRTTLAAVFSLSIARLFKLPEAYWAAITAMIVMQSTLGAALNVSRQRLVGTALGAELAALSVTYAGRSVPIFGAVTLLCGVMCAVFRLERSAYRYAGITVAIVMLVARSEPVWRVATHRFLEISLGIFAGLLITAVWPESNPTPQS